MPAELPQLLLLLVASIAAGWVDAVIGGGGLVLIPMILIGVPEFSSAQALGTNKFAAVWGTGSAAVTYLRRVPVNKSFVAWAVPLAAVCSGIGAACAGMLADDVLRPIVIVLMVAVGLFVAFRPSFGQGGQGGGWPAASRGRKLAVLALVAPIGFYDGIFGPGTGMFLIFAFTALLSQEFLTSAAMAKVVNTATNIGGLVVFAIGGYINLPLGIALAAANVVGAQFGARTVLNRGTGFIRIALLILVVVMATKLGWDQFSG